MVRVWVWILGAGLALPPSVASAALRVRGGSEAQQQRMRDAVGRLPGCIGDALTRNDVEIHIGGNSEAFYYPKEEDDRAAIEIDPNVFDNEDLTANLLKPSCVARSEFRHMPFEEVLLHEATHAWFDHNQDRVNEFLAAGYREKYQAFRNDPRVQRILTDLRTRQMESGQPVPEDVQCAAWLELSKIQVELGIVNRFPGDMHALDVGFDDEGIHFQSFEIGAHEYFAILVQSYTTDSSNFCRMANPGELAWFRDNMQECLSGGGGAAGGSYPTPECLRPNFGTSQPRPGSTGASPAGMRRN